METAHFDHIATSLAQSRDRRTALRALGVALLGAGGAALLGTQATAAKRKKRRGRGGNGGTGGNGDGGNGDGGNGDGGNSGNGGGFPGQGTCAGGADVCLVGGGSPICTCDNGRQTGLCRSQMEGGTVCAVDISKPAATTCDQCRTNGDCVLLGFPAGSSCVVDTGTNCPLCKNTTMGTCVAPCGFQEPA
jgi:hypothetical protein